VQSAYQVITDGAAPFRAESASDGLTAAYARGETDEFVKATAIVAKGHQPVRIEDGDVILFANYRSDRARQITRALIEENFDGFARPRVPKLGSFISLTEYNKTFNIPVAYPPERLKNVFGEYIAKKGLHQLRIAETEKYAHVTFFFNGGEEQPFPGEDRVLVPSPDVATYDLKPEMSAYEVTHELEKALASNRYDVIICNYANPDMVGHTGSFPATVQAIETIDHCLGRIHGAVLRQGGEMIITADHGNAEQLCSETDDQPHTAHTSNLVPFIYVGRRATSATGGSLADVAPTMLYLLGLPQPSEMSGHPLISLLE
jgi:2,3-bisphosphoglycerate-independent phosphoglycerate mutase